MQAAVKTKYCDEGRIMFVYITRQTFQFHHAEHRRKEEQVMDHVSYCRSQEELSYRFEEFLFSQQVSKDGDSFTMRPFLSATYPGSVV